jgi:hypothetical protein
VFNNLWKGVMELPKAIEKVTNSIQKYWWIIIVIALVVFAVLYLANKFGLYCTPCRITAHRLKRERNVKKVLKRKNSNGKTTVLQDQRKDSIAGAKQRFP